MLLFLTAASASPTGFSPNPSVGSFDCGQCHNQTGSFVDLAPPGDRPAIQLERIGSDDPLVGVGLHRLRLTVDTARDPEGRALGFGMAVVPQEGAGFRDRTGVLRATDERARTVGIVDADLTHPAPLAYRYGRVVLEVELEVTEPGDHLVYVVINDADGDGEPDAGDFVWNQRFCFSTDAPAELGPACDVALTSVADDPPAEPEPTGCSTTGIGPSFLAFAAFLRR